MIGNQTKGKSFRGLLEYLENREDSSLIGGNMFGRNARELSREFRLSRQLNPEALKVVHHVSLSLSPGEQLDNDTWCEIAEKYMEAMGYISNQYAIYRHSDRDHDHIHICASRISLDDGKITSDSWEYVRSEKIIRQLEREYGLQPTISSKEKLNRAPSIGQQRRLEREQLEYEQGERNTPPQQPIKTQLIELIDRATIDKPTMPQLVERLQLKGVEVRHGVTRNGKSKGISYSWNEQKFSGTSLGPAYTFPGLQKHKSIDYQPQRDDERIEYLLNNRVGRAVDNLELINAIADFIEQSAAESTLVETLPQLIEQLSVYEQQLEQGRTTLDDLRPAIAQKEQQLSSQTTVDAIAQNKAQPLTTDKPKPKENSLAELYKYYSTELPNLLLTDRDKEIANRALLDNRPVKEVEEIILASPARWTTEEAKALVLIANNQLASNKEQIQTKAGVAGGEVQHLEKELSLNYSLSSPASSASPAPPALPFTPPSEDEKLWPALKNYLTQQRGISSNLVETLHRKGLGYIDQQRKVVFIKRDLNGEKSGALVWDTPKQDDRCSQNSENTQSRQSWFHINLGRETDDKIERVFLCDSPIDALTLAHMDMNAHKGLPPVKTMYLVVDDPDNLPLEFLKNISRIGLAFSKDDQGKETAKTVLKLLPQSKQLPPNNHSWNEDLLEILHIEQEKRRQQQRGLSR
ncbi:MULTISPECIES: relaxase/mobilization nuclease domain-containing protein [unclassified Tolypothrix]|uniref:relaxase/mobilization nuclease domain-containing protein n=1 Tax=unclassified Tolypothrix TaxID=2649714 RepID=UPI0009DA4BA4|nr:MULTISPECIES: relaxase/mobilization nuclease domain-containing protein [unclassified Tolypothrix]MBE9083486.1 relaxase/mobilization nuclease domain-containing protein [Tolypothrix sp. LEGE 11397]UYD30867.1 relaxase/mobilization nuclease domain-containing protein [Tolypothrix sp. PCC 7712]BAY95660.1 relaxase/mobilization nuclease family protein [Microchaete diplosiphon NIES-3275]